MKVRTQKTITTLVSVILSVSHLATSLQGQGEQAKNTEQPVIGVSVPVLANPFWQRYVGFVNQVAQQLNVKVNVVDCQNQESKQLGRR